MPLDQSAYCKLGTNRKEIYNFMLICSITSYSHNEDSFTSFAQNKFAFIKTWLNFYTHLCIYNEIILFFSYHNDHNDHNDPNDKYVQFYVI